MHILKGKFGKQANTGTTPEKLVMIHLIFFFSIYVGMHMVTSSTDANCLP